MEKPFEESWFHAPIHALGDRARLPEAESFHLQKVLRIKPDRPIMVSNGEGSVFLCETHAAGKEIELTAVECRQREPSPPRLNLVLSLLKGRDLEEPVDALCQLAIGSIQLISTDHTQEFKGQDHSKLMERLRSKSLVALKQAKKPWLTRILPPMPLQAWRKSNADRPLVLVHPGPDRLPSPPEEDFFALVGPEGGFSEQELRNLLSSPTTYTLGLGPTRIRGVHAPLLACGKLMGLGWTGVGAIQ